jgi:hypothetical protein
MFTNCKSENVTVPSSRLAKRSPNELLCLTYSCMYLFIYLVVASQTFLAFNLSFSVLYDASFTSMTLVVEELCRWCELLGGGS